MYLVKIQSIRDNYTTNNLYFIAIMGPNGAGKSTLLKTLLGLQPPISGHVYCAGLGGSPIAFGYVPQAADLDPFYPLTGFDVAMMGAYGRIGPGRFMPRHERAFTWECLRTCAAESFALQRFAELSGGQKQLVLIARALVVKPDVLVLDEPTAGVDATTTRMLLEFISQLHAARRLTVLLVTHDMGLVRRHAERVIWLHNGRALHGTEELCNPERMAGILDMEPGG
ncbi:MAG TPA: metal ABC transporter ATP-binding protein [Chlorobaculum parvum]|uniref:Metal ABC transporter ATP-binding protein n=1 Tax=Chlorobaculum parvum TaxID=274539 RepID=A0A7C5DFP9_9CHLB|nr:metal ABC transporter ATP-binding protein [Chlorobaculum parvum]